jgi:hypothetical protein
MRSVILLALCLTLSAQNTEPVPVMSGFMKGNDYLETDSDFRTAYATGFVNGMSVAAFALNPSGDAPQTTTRWLADCVKEMTDKQIGEIIRKNIQDAPEKWHYALNVLSFNAMLGACKSYVPHK